MKNKKGFTIIELVLVLAIIGIMAALIVPLATTDNAAIEANAKARSFYFALQRVMTNYKLDYDTASSEARLEPANYFLEIQTIASFSGSDFSNIQSYKLCGDADLTSIVAKSGVSHPFDMLLYQRLRPSVLGSDSDGYFYAQIDNNYRVVRVYWSKNELIADKMFEIDNRIDGAAVGAFPFETGSSGKKIFG